MNTLFNKKIYFLFLYVFPADTVSYRHKEEGSFLIQFIAEIFPQYALADDIEELFRKVSFSNANCLLSVNMHTGVMTLLFY